MPEFVCAKCQGVSTKAGCFCNGWVCDACKNKTIPKQCSPKVTHTKREKAFLEEQLELFKRKQAMPEHIKKEWALFLEKYFYKQ